VSVQSRGGWLLFQSPDFHLICVPDGQLMSRFHVIGGRIETAASVTSSNFVAISLENGRLAKNERVSLAPNKSAGPAPVK
jgi:hypothetical protein